MALRDLATGALVRKYGQVIGRTLADVRAGEHVHVHNLGMPEDAAARAAQGVAGPALRLPADLRRTFQGLRRPDGRVATRNYIGVLTTVNCSATVARKVARLTEDDAEGVEGVDGVVALTHGTGCGMAAQGEGWDLLRRTLAGYARNPNIGGLVVIGLGCEVNTVTGLMADLGVAEHVPVAYPRSGAAGKDRPAGALVWPNARRASDHRAARRSDALSRAGQPFCFCWHGTQNWACGSTSSRSGKICAPHFAQLP